eukprot:g38924.t1
MIRSRSMAWSHIPELCQLEEEPNPFRCAELKKQLDQIRPLVEQEHAKAESSQKGRVEELTKMASIHTLRVKMLTEEQEKAKKTLSRFEKALAKAKKPMKRQCRTNQRPRKLQ